MLLPALSSARSSARLTGCLSNIKQIALGNQQYLTDNEDYAIPSRQQWNGFNRYWMATIKDYDVDICNGQYGNSQGLQCPDANGIFTYSTYDLNPRLHMIQKNFIGSGSSYAFKRLSNVVDPTLAISIFDLAGATAYGSIYMYNADWTDPAYAGYRVGTRHNYRFSLAYADGHAVTADTRKLYQSSEHLTNLGIDHSEIPAEVLEKLPRFE